MRIPISRPVSILLGTLLWLVVLLSRASPQPTAVEAIASGPTEVHVYWNPSQNAAKYAVYRDEGKLGETDSSAREYVDRTAVPGRTYRYGVGAIDARGEETRGRDYIERTYPTLPAETRCDVLVVGATTGGVSAGVTAARYGQNVVLIEETRRLGGMPVNGLGSTDLRRVEHSSGFFEEFRKRVVAIYGGGSGLSYEPRVAHQAIKEIVWSQPNLVVHREVRPVKVETRDGRITRVVAEEVRTGRRVSFSPQFVIDATDCGDVAAWGSAPFRLGREARSKREPHAGYIFYDRAGDRPLPGSTGRGDRRIQAYAYLMTVKDYGPGTDKTIPKPPGYDPRDFEHTPPWEQSWAVTSGKLPNNKFEVNQHPQGSDLQVVNYPYPTAPYAERRRIEKLYRDRALCYLYYIQTVQGKKNIGLSDDDYRDSDNWPTLLYIREARRFESDKVMDESDIARARQVARPDAIGLGDYPMDSHAVEPKTDWTRPDLGEGEFYLPQYTPWHQVPYRVMIPKRLENVFVPTAVAATHVAYGTLRLEPVRMHFGEAAGIACWLCLRYHETPRTVPSRQIQAELLKRSMAQMGMAPPPDMTPEPYTDPAYLYLFPDVKPSTADFGAIQWLGARGFYPCPPPTTKGPAAGLAATPFGPGESLTESEALRILALLARREAESGPWSHFDPKQALAAVATLSPSGQALTRARAAQFLAAFMNWKPAEATGQYADLPPGTPESVAAEALRERWIDSLVWDGVAAYTPDRRLTFKPNLPLTRAQWAQLTTLAHIYVGPLWRDHPADREEIPIIP